MGTVQFWRNPASHADSQVMTEALSQLHPMASVQDVEMITLDSFVRQRLDKEPVRFVKIDVQGYELPVLEGARSLLDSTGMTLATEVSRPDPRAAESGPDRVIDLLSACSFRPHTVDRRGRIVHSDRERITELAVNRGYIDVIWSRQRLDP